MSDGRVVNPYEVEKVIEIGKRLDVDTQVIEVDIRDPALTDLFVDAVPELRAHHLFAVTTNQYRLASILKARYGDDVTVFNGEGCDSLHNFGFSQFISIPHSDAEFAEYADNMKTWLFGPDFFKKVLDGSYASDAVYQIFLSRHPKQAFVDTQGLDHDARIRRVPRLVRHERRQDPLQKAGAGVYPQGLRTSLSRVAQGQLLRRRSPQAQAEQSLLPLLGPLHRFPSSEPGDSAAVDLAPWNETPLPRHRSVPLSRRHAPIVWPRPRFQTQ